MKLRIWFGIISVIIQITTTWITIAKDWKYYWFIWLFVVLLLLNVVPIIIIHFSRKKPKQEEIGTIADYPSDKIIESVKKWMIYDESNKQNWDNISDLQISTYTPKQEGTTNKISYYVIRMQRQVHGDLFWCATESNKIDFRNTYKKRIHGITEEEISKKAEEGWKQFKEQLDTAVLNPVIMAEMPFTELDITGQQRIGTRKVPLSYVKRQEEEKETKQEEKAHGVEEE